MAQVFVVAARMIAVSENQKAAEHRRTPRRKRKIDICIRGHVLECGGLTPLLSVGAQSPFSVRVVAATQAALGYRFGG